MKKLISWTSAITIVLAISLFSIWCGASVANLLKDAMHVDGRWCLALTPVVLIVSFAVTMFFIQGLKQFGKE